MVASGQDLVEGVEDGLGHDSGPPPDLVAVAIRLERGEGDGEAVPDQLQV